MVFLTEDVRTLPAVFLGESAPAGLSEWTIGQNIYQLETEAPNRAPDLFPLLVFNADCPDCVTAARNLAHTHAPPVVLGVHAHDTTLPANGFNVPPTYCDRAALSPADLQAYFVRGLSEIAERVRAGNSQQDHLLVELMRQLISAYSVDEIRTSLCLHAERVTGIKQVVIWQRVLPEERAPSYTAAKPDDAFAQKLSTADDGTLLAPLATRHYPGKEPCRFTSADAESDADLARVLNAVGADELLVSPLQSAFIQGYLLAIPACPGAVSAAGMRLIGQMVEETSHMLERQLLTDWTESKTTWLETTADHISEGIIYVGASGRVDYVNRQFAEQTGLPIKQLIGLDRPALLRLLATLDQDQTLSTLNTFFEHLTPHGENLLPLRGAAGKRFQLEVHQLDGGSKTMWLGLLKPAAPASAGASHRVLSHLKTHHTYALSLLRVLMDDDNANAVFRQQMQANLANTLKQLGVLLDEALTATAEVPRVQSADEDTSVNLHTLAQSVVTAMESDAITLIEPSVPVTIDGQQGELRQLMQRLFMYLLNRTQNAPVRVTFRRERAAVQIRLSHKLTAELQRQLNWALKNDIYEHGSGVSLEDHVSLSVVKACVSEHDGHIRTEPATVVVELPAPVLNIAPAEMSAVESARSKTPVERLLVCRQRSRIMSEAIYLLREQGYELQICDDLDTCLPFLDDLSAYDLVLVDGKYLRGGRQSLVRQIRERTYMPILILDDGMNRRDSIEALKAGGDDYLTMPLGEEELLTRVRVLLRRKLEQANESLVEVGNLKIDLVNYKVTLAGDPISLTHMEFKLLRVLAIHHGQVLEHSQLMRLAWGEEYADEKRQLWVYISRIRKKLEAPDDREYIQTRSGIGYVLK